jgi:hypothetical protein
VGALWNQVWSFSVNPDRGNVSQMFLQPFLSCQATGTLTLTLQSQTTANWEVEEGRWTVPVNVTSKPMFGMAAFYRGKHVFAALPRTRAAGTDRARAPRS